MAKIRNCVIVFLLAFLVLLSSPNYSYAQCSLSADLEGVKVAVYGDMGADGSADGWLALGEMFEWMNTTVDYVNASEIINDVLLDYDVFVMPGGPPTLYKAILGNVGEEAIRDFVASGGSYFGICGGSHFATTQYLGLFKGEIIWRVNGTGTKLIDMNLNRNSTGPYLSDFAPSFSTLYWDSGYFTNITSDIHQIAFYPQNNQPGMIAFQYEYGSVFLSVPHPEFEEGGDRDNTTDFDSLEDPESEWPIMLRVVQWLVEVSSESSSATDTNTLESPLGINFLIGMSSGTIIIVVAVIVIIKRR